MLYEVARAPANYVLNLYVLMEAEGGARAIGKSIAFYMDFPVL